MRAALSAAALLLPLSLAAQTRDSTKVCSCEIGANHKPNVFYFGRAARGDGPAIGVETSSGSVRDTLGVLVIGITTNGPADKAGIEEGDRIASANGVDLRLTSADAGDREMRGLMSRRLARAVQKLKAGDAVELRLYHDGQYKTVKVTTVKASDLAMDDDGMSGEMPDDIQLDMPGLRSFQRLPVDLDRIKLELPDMKPYMQELQRSLRKLKTPPIEFYDNRVHRI